MKAAAGRGRPRRQIETAASVARALRSYERRFPGQVLRRWVIDVAKGLVDGKVAGLREYPADERLTILQLAGAIASERIRQARRRDPAIERGGR